MRRRKLTYLLLVVAIGGALWLNEHQGLRSLTNQTHAALCAFRSDLAHRAADTQKFLDDVRAGRRARIAGISDADLQRSINNQRATLASLEPLRCK